jgi:hypothetical protein
VVVFGAILRKLGYVFFARIFLQRFGEHVFPIADSKTPFAMRMDLLWKTHQLDPMFPMEQLTKHSNNIITRDCSASNLSQLSSLLADFELTFAIAASAHFMMFQNVFVPVKITVLFSNMICSFFSSTSMSSSSLSSSILS